MRVFNFETDNIELDQAIWQRWLAIYPGLSLEESNSGLLVEKNPEDLDLHLPEAEKTSELKLGGSDCSSRIS